MANIKNGSEKMTDLYIVRHCEAVGNRDRTFQGVSDCDITELGQKQLDHLAERFKDIKIEKELAGQLRDVLGRK